MRWSWAAALATALLGWGVVHSEPAVESCVRVAWDYAEHPALGTFRLYLSQTAGSYPGYAPDDPKTGRGYYPIPAAPAMIRQVPCSALVALVTTPGTWYAVVTAVSLDGTVESTPSNEITFTYGHQQTPITQAPPIPPSPPVSPPVVPPAPSPWVTAPPPGVGPSPAPPPTTMRLSEMRRWLGQQAPPPPVPKDPGGDLSDVRRCLAQGKCPR